MVKSPILENVVNNLSKDASIALLLSCFFVVVKDVCVEIPAVLFEFEACIDGYGVLGLCNR